MDNVYQGADIEVNVSDFLLKFQGQINEVISAPPDENDPDSINLEQLDCIEDVRVEPHFTSSRSRQNISSVILPKKARKLKCVDERIKLWAQKNKLVTDCKYQRALYNMPRSKADYKNTQDSEDDPETGVKLVAPFSDVLVTIRVMQPFRYDPYLYHKSEMKFDRELIMLGSQYLYEFRDQLSCPCDTLGPFVDISDDPSVNVRETDKYADKTNSGFLFIGDTLYSDMRVPGNEDNSKEIIAWAEKQPDIKELKRGRMEEVRFLDLKGIRLGFPYVYQHFGSCEHVFHFSDISVITPQDNRVRSDYPYLHLLKSKRNIVCHICGIYEANHVVSESSQHIFDPVQLCAKCLSSYHYVNGEKLGEFSAYRFR